MIIELISSVASSHVPVYVLTTNVWVDLQCHRFLATNVKAAWLRETLHWLPVLFQCTSTRPNKTGSRIEQEAKKKNKTTLCQWCWMCCANKLRPSCVWFMMHVVLPFWANIYRVLPSNTLTRPITSCRWSCLTEWDWEAAETLFSVSQQLSAVISTVNGHGACTFVWGECVNVLEKQATRRDDSL